MLEPKIFVSCLHDLAAHNDEFCEWINAQDDRDLIDLVKGCHNVAECLDVLAMYAVSMPEKAREFCAKVTPKTLILRRDVSHYYPTAFLPPRDCLGFCDDFWQYEFTFCCPAESDEYPGNLQELKRIMLKDFLDHPVRIYRTEHGVPIVEILRLEIIDDDETVICNQNQEDFDLINYAMSYKISFQVNSESKEFSLIDALQFAKDNNRTVVELLLTLPISDLTTAKTDLEQSRFKLTFRNNAELVEFLYSLTYGALD